MDNIPEIHDKTPKLQSFIQEHRSWIVIAVVIVVLAIITIGSGPSKAPKKATDPATQTKPMAPEQAKQFAQELQRSSEELAQQQSRADALNAAAQKMAIQQTGCAPPSCSPVATPTAASYTTQPPAPKHESNIALSFRSAGAQAQAAAVSASSPVSDIKALIEQEKRALAQNVAVTESIQQQRVAQAWPTTAPTADVQAAPGAADVKSAPSLNQSIGPEFRLFEGTIIETVLTNRLNGSFTGPLEVQVTSPVWSHDNQHILIPQGTRAIGEAQRTATQGQQRIAVVFHRLIMPDGWSENLDKFLGLNAIGETGLKDKTDNHLLQVFGVSVALGLVQGFSQFGTGSALTANGTEQYRQGVASSIGQSSSQVLSSKLNILPTITIREGHRVRIFLRQDIDLPAYENHRIPGNI